MHTKPLFMFVAATVLLQATTAVAVPPNPVEYPTLGAVRWAQQISTAVIYEWRAPIQAQPIFEPQIDVRIDQHGEITGTRIHRSSGSYLFDASVAHALIKASPLPMPENASDFASELRFTFASSPPRISTAQTLPIDDGQGAPVAGAWIYQYGTPPPPAWSAHDTPTSLPGTHPSRHAPATASKQATDPAQAAARNAQAQIGLRALRGKIFNVGRTPEEVQSVFFKNRALFDSLYFEALRSKPDLIGKIVFSITIQPDGKVSDAKLISTEIHDETLEGRIIDQVKQLHFEPKQVPAFTYPYYPMIFKPA